MAVKLKAQKKRIGFVPTMGFLHEGHASLLKKCKKDNDVSVLSIFVNPTQFGPNEDFRRYPRNFKRDKLLAQKQNVDIIFYPSADEMYPEGFLTSVDVSRMTEGLCGKFRPGHFKGVATVVAKLLNIVQPDIFYLGQKDAQQAIVLTQMVSDLNIPVKVKILPTIRETDGLAMSSRNAYLSPENRVQAPKLYQSLLLARKLIQKGERNSRALISTLRTFILKSITNPKIDYVECVDAKTLAPLTKLNGNVLIALAVWIWKIRLIDNIVVRVK